MPPWQGGGDMVDKVTFEKTTYNQLPFKFEAGTMNYAGAMEILEKLDETNSRGDEKLTGDLVNVILNLRQDAKSRKEWGVSDKIRDELNKLGITIKDRKDGVDWER